MPTEHNNPLQTTENAVNTILFAKILGGLLILAVGLYIAIQIITIIYSVVMSPETVPFMDYFQKSGDNMLSLLENGKEQNRDSLRVSSTIATYVMLFFLLIIASGLAKRIIAVGSSLLDKLDMKYLLEQIIKSKKSNTRRDHLVGTDKQKERL